MQASTLNGAMEMEQQNKAHHEVDTSNSEVKLKLHTTVTLTFIKERSKPLSSVRSLRIYSSRSLKKLTDKDSLFYSLR